jgi:poly(3-hydroxybutyrate) depolymerase
MSQWYADSQAMSRGRAIQMRMGLRLAAVVALVLSMTSPAAAEMIEKKGRFGGLDLTYKVVLPPNFNPQRTYPAVLVFTGGGQQLTGAERTLQSDWQAEGERRGYILIAPGTPNGDVFFASADRVFPEFLDAILRDYRIQGGKLHVAGHSNGGISAFHVATKYPQYFRTVTGYPGMLDGVSDANRIQTLNPMCVFMHVGDMDPGWKSAMERQYDSLRLQGFRIQFKVEPNQVHRLRAAEINLSKRLFDQIESCS